MGVMIKAAKIMTTALESIKKTKHWAKVIFLSELFLDLEVWIDNRKGNTRSIKKRWNFRHWTWPELDVLHVQHNGE